MKLNIVTPTGEIYKSEKVEYITIPTSTGVITVKPKHEPIMTLVAPGEVVIKEKDTNKTISLAISKGLLEIIWNEIGETEIKVLADTAERAEDIDIERALKAQEEARRFMKKEIKVQTQEFMQIQAKLEKELARITVGNKYRK